MTTTFKQLVFGLAFGLSLVVVAPATASAHRSDMTEQPNIVETAVAINQQSGEFSTLIAAVSCTNLAERLQNEHRDFTVFAPTDAAFAKLGLNANNICASFSRRELTNILTYHVTRGAVSAAEVLESESLTMLAHREAEISGATIDGQNIVTTDVMASNGIIHVVDGVLLP